MNCNNVISLKQYGPTCWFNSILMAILYSDESRKLLLKKSKTWNKRIEIFKTINYILHNKYLRTNSASEDYKYFDKIRPEYLLNKLYKYNKKKFMFDLQKHKCGFKSELYIRKIYKLLGVNVLYLDIVGNNLYYSLYNNATVTKIENGQIFIKFKTISENKVKEKFENPDIIILTNNKNIMNRYPNYYKVDKKTKLYKCAIEMANNIVTDNGNEYVLDSVLLNNWNKSNKIGGHSIAGITCKRDKYVYNGWTRNTIDPNIVGNADDKNIWEEIIRNNKIFYFNSYLKESVWVPPKNATIIKAKDKITIPCELMKYNWNVNKDNTFCLNARKCLLDKMNPNDLCFSFNKGGRCIIYVKKNNIDNFKKESKKCPSGKVINPLTNRCIKVKTINTVRKNPLSKPEKNCPSGKVINPLTNRCIKVKTINTVRKNPLSKPEKNCPSGKVINPLTNRCIKVKKNI